MNLWKCHRIGPIVGFLILGGAACNLILDYDALDRGCMEGEKLCDGTCVPLTDPATGCAAESCAKCPSTNGTAMCNSSGGCEISGCNPGYKSCDGACVKIDLPEYGCNHLGCAPCYVAHGRASCNEVMECAKSVCTAPFDDCDREFANGCEVNLMENRNHCGTCDIDCDKNKPAHTDSAFCSQGTCAVLRCETDWQDGDGKFTNGCEVGVPKAP